MEMKTSLVREFWISFVHFFRLVHLFENFHKKQIIEILLSQLGPSHSFKTAAKISLKTSMFVYTNKNIISIISKHN